MYPICATGTWLHNCCLQSKCLVLSKKKSMTLLDVLKIIVFNFISPVVFKYFYNICSFVLWSDSLDGHTNLKTFIIRFICWIIQFSERVLSCLLKLLFYQKLWKRHLIPSLLSVCTTAINHSLWLYTVRLGVFITYGPCGNDPFVFFNASTPLILLVNVIGGP